MKVLVIYMEFETDEHQNTCNTVRDVLTKNDIDFIEVNRSKLSCELFVDRDLCIVIGGDGTFLRTSHFNKDTLMLGVNSDMSRKEGFFMQSNLKTFNRDFERVLDGKYNIRKLVRLFAFKNDKRLPEYITNEIYIGQKKPYDMSRYKLTIGNISENQKTSGLLIGTPMGSNAWIKSAGGPVIENEFCYVAREPYDGRLFAHKLKSGKLSEEEIIIESNMPNGICVIDSLSKEYSFSCGDILRVCKGQHLEYVEIR